MSLAPKVARELVAADMSGWPEQAEKITQTGTYCLSFDEPCIPYYSSYSQEHRLLQEFDDVAGLSWMSEYDDDGETLTREEYEAWVAANVPDGNLSAYFNDLDQKVVGEMAEINAQIGVLVNRLAVLGASSGLEVSVNLGQYGTLDPNGPWDSSSAYC